MNDLKRNRKGEEVLKTIERLCEIHGISLLVYESGPPDPLIDLPEDAHLEDSNANRAHKQFYLLLFL